MNSLGDQHLFVLSSKMTIAYVQTGEVQVSGDARCFSRRFFTFPNLRESWMSTNTDVLQFCRLLVE